MFFNTKYLQRKKLHIYFAAVIKNKGIMKTKYFIYDERTSNKIAVAIFYAIFDFIEKLKVNRMKTEKTILCVDNDYVDTEWKEVRKGRFTLMYCDEVCQETIIRIGKIGIGFWYV